MVNIKIEKVLKHIDGITRGKVVVCSSQLKVEDVEKICNLFKEGLDCGVEKDIEKQFGTCVVINFPFYE